MEQMVVVVVASEHYHGIDIEYGTTLPKVPMIDRALCYIAIVAARVIKRDVPHQYAIDVNNRIRM